MPWGQLGRDDDPAFLDPKKLQAVFQQCIMNALAGHSRPCEVRKKGPAVSIQFSVNTNEILQKTFQQSNREVVKLFKRVDQELDIKVDLVLGIPLMVQHGEHGELFIGNKKQMYIVSNTYLTKAAFAIRNCHLVVSGSFFRISFCVFESLLVKSITSEECSEGKVRAASFRAIKCLRDSLKPTTDHDGTVLPTYPLKLSFLFECLDPENVWKENQLATRVVSILNRVYEKGKEETLTSPLIKDEPVLQVADKSYKETKRILNDLFMRDKSHKKALIKNGILMSLIWLTFIFLLCGLIIFAVFCIKDNANFLIISFVCSFSYGILCLAVVPCFDVPCCWRCSRRSARYAIFNRIHRLRIFLLLIWIVMFLGFIASSKNVWGNPFPVFDKAFCMKHMKQIDANLSISTKIVLVMFVGSLVTVGLAYVIIMALSNIINRGVLKNKFRPIWSCKNCFHDIILCDRDVFCC